MTPGVPNRMAPETSCGLTITTRMLKPSQNRLGRPQNRVISTMAT